MLIGIATNFFDYLIENTFFQPIVDNIEDIIDQRHVKRELQRCAEAPAKYLESFYRNEGITDDQAKQVLNAVSDAISAVKVDARLLADTSLNTEKLKNHILQVFLVPEWLKDESLDWAFEMSLEISAEALCNIAPALQDWERVKWERSFNAFDKVIQILEKINKQLGEGGQGSQDDKLAHTYRSRLLQREAQVDISALRISAISSLDLARVFVMPDVTEVRETYELEGVATETTSSLMTLEQARQLMLDASNNKADTNLDEISEGIEETKKILDSRVSSFEFVKIYSRCVIIGAPGSGKTTLLQRLLVSIAAGELLFDGRQLTPVLLRVRALDPENLPLFDEIFSYVENPAFASSSVYKGFLERRLAAGDVVLLIDGLDEMILEKQENLIEWITSLLAVYPNNRVVLTARPYGYKSNILANAGFKEATLREFTEGQITAYVSQWSGAIEVAQGLTEDDAREEAQKASVALMRSLKSNSYVARIATNPLMLSTLCLVQRYEGGELPGRRVVLYQRCIEGLLFYWDKKRGLSDEIVGRITLDLKMLLLRRLALKMQVLGIAEIGEPEILASFSLTLEEFGSGGISISDILDNIRNRSGILVERRPHVFGFSHLTFQEYLVALAVHEHDDLEDGFEYDRLFLLDKCNDPQWLEVVALYSGLTSSDSAELLARKVIQSDHELSFGLFCNCIVTIRNVRREFQEEIIQKLISGCQKADESIVFMAIQILMTFDESITNKYIIKGIAKGLKLPMRYAAVTQNSVFTEPLINRGIKSVKNKKTKVIDITDVELGLMMKTRQKATLRGLGEISSNIIENNLRVNSIGFFLLCLFAEVLSEEFVDSLIKSEQDDLSRALLKYIYVVTEERFKGDYNINTGIEVISDVYLVYLPRLLDVLQPYITTNDQFVQEYGLKAIENLKNIIKLAEVHKSKN